MFNTLKARFTQLPRKKLFFYVIPIVGLLFLFIVTKVILHATQASEAVQSQQLLIAINNMNQNLSDLRSQLAVQLQNSTGKLDEHTQSQLQQLNESLSSLGQQESSLQNNTVQDINTTHTETLARLAVINSNLQTIKKAVIPPNYLDASHLPFKVLGIDYWNGEPKVTISISGQNDLAGQGESRDGWLITAIDANAHTVIFQNTQKQLVKVGV